MQVSIYRIICPLTNEVKYIGQTSQPLAQRLRNHISAPTNANMEKFIIDVVSKNTTPIIELIELVDKVQANNREQYWIDVYRKSDAKLLNWRNPIYKNSTTLNDGSIKRIVNYINPKKYASISVRIPIELMNLLQANADKQGRSLSNYIRLILEKSTK